MFVQVSGQMDVLVKLLKGENVVRWKYLEDLALAKPETSEEFQLLLRDKGVREIELRKSFLLHTSEEVEDEET